ncbi:MAG: recombinase family protein [Verrucomicrobiota bacterium]|nr:recombinase family protein [Verrucomicrobiota bacterium]
MKPAIKYLAYIRKSTDDNTHQVMSLAAQINELRAFANRELIVIAGILEESKSAKIPGRPVFNQLLDRIERGEANGILCWDIDRLYRNPIDEGRVRWLLQNGVIASIRTPTRQFLPEDAGLLMGVEGGRATGLYHPPGQKHTAGRPRETATRRMAGCEQAARLPLRPSLAQHRS